MELWIRSQDKEALIICRNLYVSGIYGNEIIGDDIGSLGTYKTKERALEVLDEIQMLLQPMYKVTNEFKKSELTGNVNWIENQEYISVQSKVYEMPKE